MSPHSSSNTTTASVAQGLGGLSTEGHILDGTLTNRILFVIDSQKQEI